MAVSVIIEITEIYDQSMYDIYTKEVGSIIAKYGGKYIVKSTKILPLSGNWEPRKVIVIKFDDIENVNKCFQSDEYKAIKKFREQSTSGKAMITLE